jgi:hypothetical protein
VQSSALTISIPSTDHITIFSEPTLAVNINYILAPVGSGIDLTQGGKNNALILEFDLFTANIELNRLEVSVTHGPTVTRYSGAFSPAPQSISPFRQVFPFSEFVPTRGGIVDGVFTEAYGVDILVSLALINPALPEELGFQMVLTEVRIGRVPEPGSSTLILSASVLVVGRSMCLGRTRHAHLHSGLDNDSGDCGCKRLASANPHRPEQC